MGDHRLWAPAADAMQRMIADARSQGVTIGITDSYRDLASQERLAATKGPYSQGGLAATPGTSNHGWGVATDLDLDDRALQWMRENGWRYGFVEDVPREPWHWTYRPAS
jgi:LAS superfamily LD-carboxypeptidase LdcB